MQVICVTSPLLPVGRRVAGNHQTIQVDDGGDSGSTHVRIGNEWLCGLCCQAFDAEPTVTVRRGRDGRRK